MGLGLLASTNIRETSVQVKPREIFSWLFWLNGRKVLGQVKIEYFSQPKMNCLFQKIFNVYEIFRIFLRD